MISHGICLSPVELLSMTISRSMYVTANDISFFFITEQYSIEYWSRILVFNDQFIEYCSRKAMKNIDSILKSKHYFADKGLSSQSYGFFNSHVWMWELDYKEHWAPKNWCFWTGVGEASWESLGLQDQTSQSLRKSVLNIHWKDWCWSWNSNTLATWCKELTYWKTP